MEEIWKNIQGYNGRYQVSNKGRIRSTNFNNTGQIKELKQRVNKHTGIYEVVLSKNNKRYFYTVAKLVAEHFIPNPMQKPEVMHKSRDKSDNSVENLEWAYRTELLHNMYNKGSRKNCIPSYTKLTYNGKLYTNYMQIAKDIGINYRTFYKRINELGWGLFEAAEIPAGKWSWEEKRNGSKL